MRTHTFTGATSREVLQKVKQALGDDALILSNRTRGGVIEVVALAGDDVTPAAPPVSVERDEAYTTAISAAAAVQAAPQVERPAPVESVTTFHAYAQMQGAAPSKAVAPAPAAAAPVQSAGSIDGILSEIQSLKTMLRQDIAALASDVPAAASARASSSGILGDLTHAGFSPQLAKQLVAGTGGRDENEAMALVASRLEGGLKLAEADEVVTNGGIYALVGPTGVGKTTTVAKLAARAVVRFGASKVALLTTDGYRIGAHDQLRIYGKILGVPVHVVRDANDLATALAELSGRHLVLIDTIGMSQRDHMVAEQAAMLSGSGEVKRLLLVPTTANTATLKQVVSAYRKSGVHGCILTKTDEAATLAPALDVVIRHALPLHYVTDGQRVPEDLQLPDAAALVQRALEPEIEEDDELDMAEESPVEVQPTRPIAHAVPAQVVHG